MKKSISLLLLAGIAGAASVSAENADVEALKRELQELRKKTEQLEQKLLELEKAGSPAAAPEKTQPGAASPSAVEQSGVMSQRWSPADPLRLEGKGNNYLNLSLDGLFAAGTSTEKHVEELQIGGHDPNQRGFTVQNVEMVLDGAVDPYFRAQGNLIFFIDREGETEVELEEAFLETLSLPGNLQVRAGQYLSEFGRHNPTHPHSWSFVDSPLVNARFLGSDGLRNPGARISWLVPTPFYSELLFSVQNSHGTTASSFRSTGHSHGEEDDDLPFAYRHSENDRGLSNVGDLLFAPRYALSYDVTENQVLLLGASAAFGPNSSGAEGGDDTDTQIYGADLTWKWKSPRHSGGFPFVMFQTEGMVRRYKAGSFDWDEDGDGALGPGEIADDTTGLPAFLASERLTDYGLYAQLLYGFRKGWVAGIRGDYVTSDTADYETASLSLDGEPLGRDPWRAERWRISPNLTWYPTEFSKLRLQYNYDRRSGIDDDHSVWLQFEFLLGAHAAHKF